MNTKFLEEKGLDGYISSRKLSRQDKKYNLTEKPFSKDNFNYNNEIGTYVCPFGQPLYQVREYEYKNKPRIAYWTKECKNCTVQEYCAKKTTLQNNQRLWKPFQNQNATKNGNIRSTKNLRVLDFLVFG